MNKAHTDLCRQRACSQSRKLDSKETNVDRIRELHSLSGAENAMKNIKVEDMDC